MSYLHSPRLTFSGDFISDVSTVNNDPAHYNNNTFESSFREFGQGATNGWWNPEGGATFAFQNCMVKHIVLEDGSVLSDPSTDMIIGQIVCGAEGRNTGKMVDLDPQEQGSSELWGVTLRILSSQNDLLLEGKIKATAFRDLQMRQQSGAKINGQGLGGTWTSVIENVVWGEKAAASPFLTVLKAATQSGKLSINLNAFGYYYNHATDGRFSMGRIIGSIGPWLSTEPDTFAACRRLYGIAQSGKGKTVFFSNSNFLFEKQSNRVTVDLGSSFPIADALGSISLKSQLFLAVSKILIDQGPGTTPVIAAPNDFVMIGEVKYLNGPDWLNDTGGISTFNDLSADIINLLENNQLILLTLSAAGKYIVIARESLIGMYVRADNFVNRLDAGQTNKVNFYAYRYGVPLKNMALAVSLEPATPVTPVGPGNPICEIPGNNYPEDGIEFESQLTTDDSGLAVMHLAGNKLTSGPRGYMDGQIYILDYQFRDIPQDPAIGPFSNDNIFIHLRDYFEVPQQPCWKDIEPTMIQFANLYPIMSKYFIDFSDPGQLISKKEILKFAFNRDIDDPVYMPATRDLSEGKRQAILKWLDNPVVSDTKEMKFIDQAVTRLESPAAPDKPLTDNQLRLKNAVRAKNGSMLDFTEINNLFDF